MKLAINGGRPVRKTQFPIQKTLDYDETKKVTDFMLDNNILSGYRGNFSPDFWGGEQVQEFEKELSNRFKRIMERYVSLGIYD